MPEASQNPIRSSPSERSPDLCGGLEGVWPGSRVESVAPIPESHSGFTYLVTAELEGQPLSAVLRLPPPGARPAGPADVARQARIMEALHEARAPVPRILAASAEPVLDGRPFVLMERVVAMPVAEALQHSSSRDLVAAAFAAIRAVHELPADRTGLSGEEAVSPRAEVERWQALRSRAPEELLRHARRLEERLLAVLPAPRKPALVHGDYHLGNLLYEDGAVVAILDWEIAELGQGALDDAALCMLAVRAPFGEPHPGAEAVLPLDEMVALASADEDFTWYLAATCHKYASILGYNLGLHRRGKRIDPVYEELLVTIPGLIDAGLRFLD
jgi:aminoglycoside phosphotransferase (APT) family kinase protein